MTRRKRILAGSGSAAAIVAVFCGVALAAGVAVTLPFSGNDGNTINGCYSPGGALKLRTPSNPTCSPGAIPITWSHRHPGTQGIQGVKGDQGAKGDPGIQGIKGDQGDQEIQGVKGDQGIQGLKVRPKGLPDLAVPAISIRHTTALMEARSPSRRTPGAT